MKKMTRLRFALQHYKRVNSLIVSPASLLPSVLPGSENLLHLSRRRWASSLSSAHTSTSASQTATWRDLLSPRKLFVRVRELGPTALVLYGGLWVGPFVASYVGALACGAADPLLLLTAHWPAAGDGLRSTIGTVSEWAGVTLLPPPGVPMDARISAGLWAYIVTDVVEPLRLLGVLWGAPKILQWRKRGAT